LADVGLYLEAINQNRIIELKSKQIFLDSSLAQSARQVDANAVPVMTYFVNEFRANMKTTPYSFVAASGQHDDTQQLRDDEIIVNSWLANDLQVIAGDSISLTYYILGPMRQLIEKTSVFNIKSIVPLTETLWDKNLMPAYPGLADKKNCWDWDPGIPINFEKIRKKDEDYWFTYQGTPKAFVTLKAAQKMWKNRYGDLTAIRFKGNNQIEIEQKLKNKLNPESFGMVFIPSRQQGIDASQESVDFAELFLGLSFFIIIAALVLTGLLFVLSIEQRSQETGLFLAVGFTRKQIRKLLVYETGILAIMGGILGSFLGIIYNQVVLLFLNTLWKDAVGTSALQMHIEISSVMTGSIAGIAISFLTMLWVIRNQTRQTVSRLQAGAAGPDVKTTQVRSRISFLSGVLFLAVAVVIILLTDPGKGKDVMGSFFGVGALILISGILFTNVYLTKLRKKTGTTKLSISDIGVRNSARNKVRSLMLTGLLASGLFIIFTVGANRHGTIENADQRSSGTGGFALYAESLIPVLYDLNSKKGIDFYGLEEMSSDRVRYVPFRIKEGDDASCLNLNRVSNPQLLGVNPEHLDQRQAFTFSSLTAGVSKEHPWLSLNEKLSDNVIAGIADETVIIWGLGKSVGDTLHYLNERGNPFRIKLVAGLANSIFQGNIIIAEDIFTQKYPAISGHRLFLADTPPEAIDSVHQGLSWAMQDMGMDITLTAERLSEFNKVENTYLSIFLMLGGFGLILGTIGLGIIVVRNILERRGELGLLRAVGFSRKSIQFIVLSEHLFLLMIGITLGAVASLLAVLPALMSPGVDVPYSIILITFFLILGSGIFWIYFATSMAMRGNLLSALRKE
jgi:putative ABC transport system permease protein